jgi:hypothetical protein
MPMELDKDGKEVEEVKREPMTVNIIERIK